jgi:hypothetical protein
MDNYSNWITYRDNLKIRIITNKIVESVLSNKLLESSKYNLCICGDKAFMYYIDKEFLNILNKKYQILNEHNKNLFELLGGNEFLININLQKDATNGDIKKLFDSFIYILSEEINKNIDDFEYYLNLNGFTSLENTKLINPIIIRGNNKDILIKLIFVNKTDGSIIKYPLIRFTFRQNHFTDIFYKIINNNKIFYEGICNLIDDYYNEIINNDNKIKKYRRNLLKLSVLLNAIIEGKLSLFHYNSISKINEDQKKNVLKKFVHVINKIQSNINKFNLENHIPAIEKNQLKFVSFNYFINTQSLLNGLIKCDNEYFKSLIIKDNMYKDYKYKIPDTQTKLNHYEFLKARGINTYDELQKSPINDIIHDISKLINDQDSMRIYKYKSNNDFRILANSESFGIPDTYNTHQLPKQKYIAQDILESSNFGEFIDKRLIISINIPKESSYLLAFDKVFLPLGTTLDIIDTKHVYFVNNEIISHKVILECAYSLPLNIKTEKEFKSYYAATYGITIEKELIDEDINKKTVTKQINKEEEKKEDKKLSNEERGILLEQSMNSNKVKVGGSEVNKLNEIDLTYEEKLKRSSIYN